MPSKSHGFRPSDFSFSTRNRVYNKVLLTLDPLTHPSLWSSLEKAEKLLIFFWKCTRDVMFHGTRAGFVLLTISSATTGLYHVGCRLPLHPTKFRHLLLKCLT